MSSLNRIVLVVPLLLGLGACGRNSSLASPPPSGGIEGGAAGDEIAGTTGATGTAAATGAAGTENATGAAGAAGATGSAGTADATAAAGATDAAGADDALPVANGPPDAVLDGQVPSSNPINPSNWNETTLYPLAKRRLLLRDEGDPHLVMVDLSKTPALQWKHIAGGPWARSMQLIGNNQILGGRSDGYEVFDYTTGAIVKTVNGFPNTQSAYRMATGETMLTTSGTVLKFLDKNDVVSHQISYPGYGFTRLARPTRNGTFLVPSDVTLFEGDATGKVLWTAQGATWAHIEEALLMASGDALVCTFFGASCDVVDKTTHLVTKRYGTKMMADAELYQPNCFAEFEILPNGNIITSNWQGHGSNYGASGIQVIEFNPAGDVVWFYKQDPTIFSSIQGVMVLDGKDPQYLHVQETSTDSTWQPVIPTPTP